jgi:hypothetical protein
MLRLACKPHTKVVMAPMFEGFGVMPPVLVQRPQLCSADTHIGIFILANQKEDVNQRRREVHPSRVDREALSAWRECGAFACVPCLPPR